MAQDNNKDMSDKIVTYNDLNRAELEPVPAKSPHRKYLVLVALHMLKSDDPDLLCEAADCSERTFHYVKNRLRDHDGVVFNHDRSAKRYFVIETGVLDLPKVVDMMRKLYPNRYAYIEELVEKTGTLDSMIDHPLQPVRLLG